MIENEFGKLLERLIYFSSQKNYSLAITLGYDVSYISKWINSTTLPSSKNIKNINKKIANFIVGPSSKLELDNMANYFNIKVYKDTDISAVLKSTIEEELNRAYLYTYNQNRNKDFNKRDKDSNKSDNYNNSIQTTNPSFIKKYLSNEISDFINEAENIEIILLCNLFKLTNEDKIKITGAEKSKNKNHILKRNNIMIKYLMTFDENTNDLLFDVSLFIYIATSKNRIESIFYSGDFPTNTFMSVVKNKCSHTAIYDNNNKSLMGITSTDSKAVEELYEVLTNMINTQSRKTFLKMTPEEMILSQDKINYIINGKLKILAGEMTELFMPSDLFLEVGKEIFKDNKDALSILNKINTIFQELTYNSKMNIVLYEDVFKKYIYNGNITFFNNQITLTMEQRKRHIEYMKSILKEKDNISLNLADDTLLDNYKEEEKMSLYLSKENTFLKEKYNGISRNYLMVKDIKLEKVLNLFFDQLWNEKGKENDKNKVINLIEDSIKYIEIFN